MTTLGTTTLIRAEIAAWALTSPAVVGAATWIISWLGYFASVYLSVGFIRNTTAIQIVFVLMILIGPLSSLAAIVLTRSRLQTIRFSTILYLVNGVWMIVSLAAFALRFSRDDFSITIQGREQWRMHLVIETPEPTLVKGMQWMLGTFTARFNARHQLRGHLFSGRYKAIVVDHVDDWYLRRACDYSHLNPVRAGILGPQQRLEQYAWSSYPMYLQSPRKRPAWLRVDRLLGEHGVARDSAAGRREFSKRVEVRRLEEDAELRQTLKRGWRLGAQNFLDRLQDSLGLSLSEDHAAAARRETLEVRAQRLIDEELHKQKRSREDLVSLPKGASLKVTIAERLHRETPMTMRWIADALHMGTWRYLSFLLYQRRSASQ